MTPYHRPYANQARCLAAGLVAVVCSMSGAWGDQMYDDMAAAIEAGDLAGLHATVVMMDGDRIAEAYFPGEDEVWGRPLGRVEHGPETLHDVRSVTKSIVGLLYGIALAKGAVPSLDPPLLDLFPEYADLRDGTDRELMTVGHALTMQMGTQWDESLPYTDPRNSEVAMEYADDRYRFILDRTMVAEPGTTWIYNGGAVALIGRLIADGTGMSLDEYARQSLFEPLGIRNFEWISGGDGVPSAASGLRLTARDLATIGVMVAQGGTHEGRQIVPSDWLDAALQPIASTPGDLSYGYLWYVTTGPGGDPILLALGNGGQRLTVQPQVGFVVSTFTGNYNQPDSWQMPLRVLLEFAIPAARRHNAD